MIDFLIWWLLTAYKVRYFLIAYKQLQINNNLFLKKYKCFLQKTC